MTKAKKASSSKSKNKPYSVLSASKKKDVRKIDVKKNVREFKNIFSEFGEAVGSILKDSKLQKETQKIGKDIVGAGKALVERIKNKEVKKEFKDVRRAAQEFGKGASKTIKASQPKIKKAVKKATKQVVRTVNKTVKKMRER